MDILEVLEDEEGFRGSTYTDTEGFETIGIGTKLPITKEEAKLLLEHRLRKLELELQAELNHLFIDDEAWDVLYMMAYQMGVNGVLKFKKMIKALEVQDYVEASNQMRQSRWYIQTPLRAERMARIMEEI